MNCRHCSKPLTQTFIDLGCSPPSNSYLTQQGLTEMEKWYPLKVMVCGNCWLAQTEDIVDFDEMFSDQYAYFSSYSKSWLAHAKSYVDKMISRFNLTSKSVVMEVAANDGYLLQFVKSRGISCVGIEPTHIAAQAAREKGLEIIEDFFGEDLALRFLKKGRSFDLIVANNVLAHVPDINDFVRGVLTALNLDGVATFEFPHLLNLVEQKQFDTIYHEHFSYLSLNVVINIFKDNGLTVFDVEELPTHGGSLRVFAQCTKTGKNIVSNAVKEINDKEEHVGLRSEQYYRGFSREAERIKMELLLFLIKAKKEGKAVIAYGAAAKGNTLINYAGVRRDLIPYVVDKNPMKIGKFMPGSRIPIKAEEQLKIDKPPYVLILPWNLKVEVMEQLQYIRDWGGQFIVVIPHISYL
jgi:SAM-dependent methyltransferase